MALTSAETQFVYFLSDFRMSKAISQVRADSWLFMLFALRIVSTFNRLFMESETFDNGYPEQRSIHRAGDKECVSTVEAPPVQHTIAQKLLGAHPHERE